MRLLLLTTASVIVLSGCEAMGRKVEASQQDRCARADWALVGERDGTTGPHQQLMIDRYSHICGDMFKEAPYKEGYAKGAARRPKPGA